MTEPEVPSIPQPATEAQALSIPQPATEAQALPTPQPATEPEAPSSPKPATEPAVPTSDTGWSKRASVILGVGVLAQAILAWIYYSPVPRPLVGDEEMYWHTARLIARGDTPKPTLVWPPLQSWLLAGFFSVFGESRIPIQITHTLIFLFSAFLLRRLVLWAGLGARAADVAFALMLLDPQIASMAQSFWPEVTHWWFVLSALFLLFLATPRFPELLRAALGGVLMGLALLLKAIFGPMVPFMALAAALAPAAASRGRRVALAAAFVGGVLIPTVPVIVYHGTNYGIWAISESGLFNLWVGLRDPQKRIDYVSVDVPSLARYLKMPLHKRNEMLWRRVKKKVREDGVGNILWDQVTKQPAHLFDRSSFFSDQLAGGRWGKVSPRGLRSNAIRLWAYLAYATTMVLAAFGVFQLHARKDWRAFGLAVAAIVYQLGLFLFLHINTRYRITMLLPFIMLGALAVDRIHLQMPPDRGSRLRLAGGALLSVAVLCLIFWPTPPHRHW